jgi:single-stranded-DNA-specific exonuclease
LLSTCSVSNLKLYEIDELTKNLARQLSCSELTAVALEMGHEKRLADIDNMQAWLRPQGEKLLNSLNLGSAASCAAEKWRSRPSFGNVMIYGDYDTDGIASTVLAMEIFRHKALEVRYFIPRRDMQGYGLHAPILDRLAESGCNTLVVVDCGTNDVDLLDALSRRGVEIFVFDHHSVSEGFTPFPLTVNPWVDGDATATKLCATAVLWSWAWKEKIVSREWLRYALDLVALATISDCMPLDSLNRALVQKGMTLMRGNPRRGLAALFEKLGVPRRSLTEEQLSMRVIPCLNAPGRIGCADISVRVLLGSGEVGDLIRANRKRQMISERIAGEICEPGVEKRHVMYDESWPVGVLSGVASRICSMRRSPVALAAPVGGKIRGTLRVPAGANAVHILGTLSERLEAWGGHRYAAGFSVLSDRWTEVESSLEELLSDVRIEEELLKAVAMSPAQISLGDWKNVGELSPFGNDNPCPYFYRAKEGEDKIIPLGRDGKHSAIVVDDAWLLAFNAASELQDASLAENVKGWLYHPRIDHWRNEERVQFVLDYAVLGS